MAKKGKKAKKEKTGLLLALVVLVVLVLALVLVVVVVVVVVLLTTSMEVMICLRLRPPWSFVSGVQCAAVPPPRTLWGRRWTNHRTSSLVPLCSY